MSKMIDPPQIGRVIKEWKVNYPDPIVVEAGELVTPGATDPEWPGWQWCTDRRGKSGWVPVDYFSLIDDKTGKMRFSYSAQELAVEIGDEIKLHQLESGWYLATTQTGNKGWVPARNVEVEQKQTKN
jgi:uncharacterized protein YgiM (DUF1202 family)